MVPRRPGHDRDGAQIETLAETVPDNGGCYIVPAFSGLYSPRWHPTRAA